MGKNFSIALTPSVRRDARVEWPEIRSRKVSAPALAAPVEPGGFGDGAGVCTPTAIEQRVRSQATVFIAELDTRLLDRTDRPYCGGDASLHVARPTPEQSPVDDSGVERRTGPVPTIAGEHHVDMTVEHQPSASTGTGIRSGQDTDCAPRLVSVDLTSGEVRPRQHLVERDLPMVNVQAVTIEQPRHVVDDLVLGIGTADARHLDQVGQNLHHVVSLLIEQIEDCGDVALDHRRTVPRRITLLRHPGPTSTGR